MKAMKTFLDDTGTAAIEFAITSSVFIMLLVGIAEGGYALWVQLGIQHGAEMAARCATVNTTTCGTSDAIKTYAAAQSYGVSPPTSTFTVTTPSCGNQVAASYTYTFLSAFFSHTSATLTGRACFPK
jgi:Flp pilus assembly protein TadG